MGELVEILARSALYKLLSIAFLPPSSDSAEFFSGIGRVLERLPDKHQAVLGPIAQEGPITPSERSEGEYARLFGVGLAATPYETEYDPLAAVRKGHRLADLLGFYEAFGFRLAASVREFPDHIAGELEFMSLLLLKSAQAKVRSMDEAEVLSEEAARKFLVDHLGTWVGAFAERVEANAEAGFYSFAARLLKGFVRAEIELIGAEPVPPVLPILQESGPVACPFASECGEGPGRA